MTQQENRNAIIGEEWSKFCAVFESAGYTVLWNVFNIDILDGSERVVEVNLYPCLGKRVKLEQKDAVDYKTPQEARKAAYQWLLSRHCVIGMAVIA
ncbi:hypothetical protein [Tumebacillus lipolyticus]|uniref:ATP-grasp domain-containing protein n=1 Tax=Tumebacillus lipolyticus TaxID=1280370 RepID=A0ABW5A2D6_9BACL